jgi:ATP-dependent Zn protease
MNERYPRGTAYHEAGHAIVAFALDMRVVAVRVVFTEEKGWHGGTDTLERAADQLSWEDRITLRIAGKAAEELFDCPADPRASHHDLGEIASLLDRMGMSDKREAHIAAGKARARIILQQHRERALRLIGHLVEHGRIDEAEFERLMNDE